MNTKEELRQRRKDAYQKAKAKRDADPRYHALKERQKLERKAAYRALKEQRDQEKLAAKQKRIAEKDAMLMKMVMTATDLEKLQQMMLCDESDLNQGIPPVAPRSQKPPNE